MKVGCLKMVLIYSFSSSEFTPMSILIIAYDFAKGTERTYLLTIYVLQLGSVSYLQRKET
jgi:hypothetical protein